MVMGIETAYVFSPSVTVAVIVAVPLADGVITRPLAEIIPEGSDVITAVVSKASFLPTLG